MRDSKDPGEFGAYLKEYPEGRFATLAALRRDKAVEQSKKATTKTTVKKQTPKPVKTASKRSTGIDFSKADPEAVAFCRQYASPESMGDCVAQYEPDDSDDDDWIPQDRPYQPNPQSSRQQQAIPGNYTPPLGGGAQGEVWYDNYYNQWQVSSSGASFSATANIPGTGSRILTDGDGGPLPDFGAADPHTLHKSATDTDITDGCAAEIDGHGD